jgi:TctA family transporter
MRRLDVPILPMVLGVVLGFMVESNYRRSLLLSGNDHMIFQMFFCTENGMCGAERIILVMNRTSGPKVFSNLQQVFLRFFPEVSYHESNVFHFIFTHFF